MEASLEERLRSLEARLARVERLLAAGAGSQSPPGFERVEPAEPAPEPGIWPPPQPIPPRSEPAEPRAPREPVNLEQLLGGRVLAWLGGIAVFVGVVFFLVMAVSRGWIDEPTRVTLAFVGSAALLGAALWLYERAGQTQAALAAAAAALASLYASLTVGTLVYDLIPAEVGFAIAGLVGVVGAAIAVRWSSQIVGGIGILGALLAPVLVDAGASTASLAFMAIALVAAVAVLVWQRWPWLAFGSFLVSVLQLGDWIENTYGNEHEHVLRILVVLVLYWALFLVAALASEVRMPTERLRVTSALLLLADLLLVAAAGWIVLHEAGHEAASTAWVLALAAGHVGLGLVAMRAPISRQIALLLTEVGLALSAVGFALALDGPALVAGWAVHAAMLAWIAARTQDRRALFAGAAYLALAIAHVVVFEAPPDALAYGLDEDGEGLVAVVIVALAAAFAAWVARGVTLDSREPFAIIAATAAVYLVSVAIIDASGASEATGTAQGGQLLLSAFWSLTGLMAIVLGLLRERLHLRIGGLVLLGAAVFKVFFVDLATLDSIYRVGSFIALGLLLMAGAFAYQRVRREVQE
jgi:uncharacterized membrane protein